MALERTTVRTTESLLEQELAETNRYLTLFENAHDNYALFFGGSLVTTAALPVLLLVYWLLGEGPIGSAAVTGTGMLAVGYGLAFYWWHRRTRLFDQIQSRCLKLQRAGFVVFKKAVFLRNAIGAATKAPEEDVQLLDFERLCARELHYTMI